MTDGARPFDPPKLVEKEVVAAWDEHRRVVIDAATCLFYDEDSNELTCLVRFGGRSLQPPFRQFRTTFSMPIDLLVRLGQLAEQGRKRRPEANSLPPAQSVSWAFTDDGEMVPLDSEGKEQA